jgi:hypothetical protein
MTEEPESASEFCLYATLAALPVFWGIVFIVLASVLNEDLLSQIGLDMGLALWAVVPLLIVSGLMLEQAFAVRKREDAS